MKKSQKVKAHIGEERAEGKSVDLASTVTDLSKDVMKGIWEDFFRKSVTQTAPEQLFSKRVSEHEISLEEQDLIEGKETLLTTEGSTTELIESREFKEYVRTEIESETFTLKAENKQQGEIEKKIQLILDELKKLKHSSPQMELILKEVDTNTMPVNAGRYHENFLEWILNQMRRARQRIDEGPGWTQMFASKKGQKQYWNMFKKHGTTFGLSSERTTATQTG